MNLVSVKRGVMRRRQSVRYFESALSELPRPKGVVGAEV